VNRKFVIAAAAAAVVIVVVIVLVVLANRTTTVAGPSLPPSRLGPTSAATSTPGSSATPGETEEGFDEGFGDTVVDVGDEGAAEFENGLEARFVSVQKTEVSGSGIGAANGPAYDVIMEFENTSSKTIDLGSVVVNAYTGDERTPATPAEGEDAQPFAGTLAAGKIVRGHYYFGVAATDEVLRVTLSTSADSGLVVLEYR
jgi:hypothetical protein